MTCMKTVPEIIAGILLLCWMSSSCDGGKQVQIAIKPLRCPEHIAPNNLFSDYLSDSRWCRTANGRIDQAKLFVAVFINEYYVG